MFGVGNTGGDVIVNLGGPPVVMHQAIAQRSIQSGLPFIWAEIVWYRLPVWMIGRQVDMLSHKNCYGVVRVFGIVAVPDFVLK